MYHALEACLLMLGFRTLSFAILGMSLSGVFDNTNAADFLKSLLNILNEHEQTKDTDYKPKMVRLFPKIFGEFLICNISEVLQVKQNA